MPTASASFKDFDYMNEHFYKHFMVPLERAVEKAVKDGAATAKRAAPYDRFKPTVAPEPHLRDTINVEADGPMVSGNIKGPKYMERRAWMHEIGTSGVEPGVKSFPAFTQPKRGQFMVFSNKGKPGYRMYNLFSGGFPQVQRNVPPYSNPGARYEKKLPLYAPAKKYMLAGKVRVMSIISSCLSRITARWG